MDAAICGQYSSAAALYAAVCSLYLNARSDVQNSKEKFEKTGVQISVT